jgi:DNA-binding SARP family transcriptional activator/DNA-binding MarR family transcriptional regulator
VRALSNCFDAKSRPQVRAALLGPVEVRVDGKPCVLGPPKQRALLVILLLHAGRVVPMKRIVEELWGDEPPASATANLRSYTAGLRRVFPAGERGRIVARPAGYLLRMAPEELDVAAFEHGAVRGRRALDRDDAATAVRDLERALAVWRGQAAEDIRVGPVVAPLLESLEERRRAVVEDWAEARLAVEPPAQVLPALRNLTAAEPLRERGWMLLMQALADTGDSAGALATYAAARSALATHLGIEPGAPLRRLHQAILSGERPPLDRAAHRPPLPAGSPAAASVEPLPWRVRCDLPAATRNLVGRGEAISEISTALLAAHDPDAARVVAITGGPGFGKTALAVAVAHQLRPQFPDGQWFVPLGGTAWRSPDVVELLDQLCAAGGLPSTPPLTVDRRAAALRAVLADRRVLIVLDDAASADQVRPLLPGRGGSAVIVTSRHALTGLVALEAAHALHLAALTPEQSTNLLTRLLGDCAVDARPGAVDEVVRQCAGLPLALRIAAANICAAGCDVNHYALSLREERNRLSVLEVQGDHHVAIRSSFDRSYRRLSSEARRLFRLLGTLPPVHLELHQIAAAHGVDGGAARRALTGLLGAGLVEHDPDRGYRLHDLLRLYARERAEIDESPPGSATTPRPRRGLAHRTVPWLTDGSPA